MGTAVLVSMAMAACLAAMAACLAAMPACSARSRISGVRPRATTKRLAVRMAAALGPLHQLVSNSVSATAATARQTIGSALHEGSLSALSASFRSRGSHSTRNAQTMGAVRIESRWMASCCVRATRRRLGQEIPCHTARAAVRAAASTIQVVPAAIWR